MLFKQILANGSFKFVSLGLNLVVLTLMAKRLGSEGYGLLNWYMSIFALTNVIILNGSSSYLISLLSESRKNEYEVLSKYLSITLSVYLLVLALLTPFILIRGLDYTESTVYVCLALSELFSIIYIIYFSYQVARINQVKANMPDFKRLVLTKSLQTLSLFILPSISLIAVAILIGNLFMLYTLRGFIKSYLTLVKVHRVDLKDWIKGSLSFLSFTMVKQLPVHLDKALLGFVVPYSLLGVFTLSQKIGGLVEMLSMSVGLVMFPYFKSLSASKELKLAIKTIVKFELLFFYLIFPVLLFILLRIDIILDFIGSDYKEGTLMTRLYIVGSIFSLYSMTYNTFSIGFVNLSLIVKLNVIVFILGTIPTVIIMFSDLEKHYLVIGVIGLKLLMAISLLLGYLYLAKSLIRICIPAILVLILCIFCALFSSERIITDYWYLFGSLLTYYLVITVLNRFNKLTVS